MDSKLPGSPLSSEEESPELTRWRKWGLRLAMGLAACVCLGPFTYVVAAGYRYGPAWLTTTPGVLAHVVMLQGPVLMLCVLTAYVALRRGPYGLASRGALAGIGVIVGAGDVIWLLQQGGPRGEPFLALLLFGVATALSAVVIDTRRPARWALLLATWALALGPLAYVGLLVVVAVGSGWGPVASWLPLIFAGPVPVIGAGLLTRLILAEPA